MKKILFALFLIMAFMSPSYAVTTYKWVDKDGAVHYTDDYNQIPSMYRDRVETEVREEAPQVKTPAPSQPPAQKSEEVKADIQGQNEAYWRQRVRPWKERLKEAEANYDAVHKKFMEKALELSAKRFGSRTQYKMDIIELDKHKEEMVKYGEQIAEANEMLDKISKEAKEAKANPEWLQ